MRQLVFLTAVFGLFLASPCFALSIDRTSGMNEDGTAKFSDPDDQKPNFMTPPAVSSTGQPQSQSNVTLPMTRDGSATMNFSVNHADVPQPDAFDRAFKQK